jgi:hypothetical protein
MYHVLGLMFGVATPTVHKHLHAVIAVLKKRLHYLVSFPRGSELRRVIHDFHFHTYGMPMVAGALDGCFIPMTKPPGPFNWRYWCYKNFCSILLLAVCDARGVFTYLDVGRPGCFGDAAAFQCSTLARALADGNVLSPTRTVQGITLRPVILADSAFPFQPYIMKQFDTPLPNTKESLFNFGHIRGRRIIESAFGRLKGRWWVLRKNNLRDPKFLTDVTFVCCYLHNFCEQGAQHCLRAWRHNCRRVGGHTDVDARPHNRANTRAAEVRQALAEHMWIEHRHRHQDN